MSLRLISKPADPGNFHKGRLRPIRLAVAHGTVTPAGPPHAAQVAAFFAQHRPQHPSSAHVTVDGGGVAVRSVADADTAFAAPNANADGLHLEMCMKPTRDAKAGAAFWATDLGARTLAEGAEITGMWVARYHLPIRWLTPAQVRAGEHGLCDHATISAAYNPGGHWDVGAGFPVGAWLKLVTAAANRPAVKVPAAPPPHSIPKAFGAPAFHGALRVGSHGTAVERVQQRLHDRGWRIKVDGQYRSGTAGVVADFQHEKRLHVTGVVDLTTWRALWALPVTS